MCGRPGRGADRGRADQSQQGDVPAVRAQAVGEFEGEQRAYTLLNLSQDAI